MEQNSWTTWITNLRILKEKARAPRTNPKAQQRQLVTTMAKMIKPHGHPDPPLNQ
jgi:hypothetical protein